MVRVRNPPRCAPPTPGSSGDTVERLLLTGGGVDLYRTLQIAVHFWKFLLAQPKNPHAAQCVGGAGARRQYLEKQAPPASE